MIASWATPPRLALVTDAVALLPRPVVKASTRIGPAVEVSCEVEPTLASMSPDTVAIATEPLRPMTEMPPTMTVAEAAFAPVARTVTPVVATATPSRWAIVEPDTVASGTCPPRVTPPTLAAGVSAVAVWSSIRPPQARSATAVTDAVEPRVAVVPRELSAVATVALRASAPIEMLRENAVAVWVPLAWTLTPPLPIEPVGAALARVSPDRSLIAMAAERTPIAALHRDRVRRHGDRGGGLDLEARDGPGGAEGDGAHACLGVAVSVDDDDAGTCRDRSAGDTDGDAVQVAVGAREDIDTVDAARLLDRGAVRDGAIWVAVELMTTTWAPTATNRRRR